MPSLFSILFARSTSSAWFLVVALFLTGCGDSGGSMFADAGFALDQCVDPIDLAIFDSTLLADAGPPLDGGMTPDAGPGYSSRFIATQEVALACGLGDCLSSILNEQGEAACMRTCFDVSPLAGISQGCLDCAVETVQCAKQHCVIECVANETECRQCLVEHCLPQLGACTGFEG